MGAFKSKQLRARVPLCWACDLRLWGGGRFYVRMLDPAGHPRPVHKGCVAAAEADGLRVAEEQPEAPKPIQRSAPPKKRREGQRRTRCKRSAKWKAEVRRLPCVGLPDGTHAPECSTWPTRDASHLGRDGGQGMKASDDTTVPHTRPCHNAWGDSKRWTQEQRRAFADRVIAETQTTVTANLAGVGGAPGVFAW